MNTWKKLPGIDQWCVACPSAQEPGTVVTVTNRSGESKTVTLGAFIQDTGYAYVYAVAPTPKAAAAP